LTFKFIYSSAFTTEGSTNVVINNSEVYYSGISGKLENSVGENFWIADTDNTIIQNNKIYYPSAVPINLWHTRGTKVIGNTVSNCDLYPDSWHAGIYFDGCRDSIAQNNVVTNCALGYQVGSEVSGSTSTNISFTGNIANKCKTSFIINSVQNKISNSKIIVRQNTFYRDQSPTGFVHDVILQYYNDLTFKDNIIVNSETGDFSILKWENSGSISTNTAMDYNLWYSGGNVYKFTLSSSTPDTFAEFKSLTGQESHGKTGNPLFTNAAGGDFTLNNTAAGGALVRGAGVPTGTLPFTFPGLSLTGYDDLGALQHRELPAIYSVTD
jgi:parallel beta-helix repeat protein